MRAGVGRTPLVRPTVCPNCFAVCLVLRTRGGHRRGRRANAPEKHPSNLIRLEPA